MPIPSGSTAGQAIANTIDLAQRAEAAGYQRYWVAEHHLNPGVAGTTPALLIALIANATRTLRVGSGAVLMGHHTPLAVVEQFGILDAVHPGRIDLGLGRSGFKRLQERTATRHRRGHRAGDTDAPSTPPSGRRTDNGLLIPPPFSFAHLIGSPRAALQVSLLQQPNAETPDYAEQIDDVLALIGGTYRGADGTEAHVVPGEDAELDVWILGSSGGDSAEVAGRRGLPFAANYHVAPSSVLEAVEAYRSAFRPSATLARPHVSRLGRRRRGPHRPRGPRTRHRIRTVGAQHPQRRGRDPVPDARRGALARRGRTTIRRWCRTGSTPSSSDRPIASPTSSASSPTRPAPTSC